MKESDIRHLGWIHERMVKKHGENQLSGHMFEFGKIINSLKPKMKETKRYRLEIPEESLFYIKDEFTEHNNKEVYIPYGHMFEDCEEVAIISFDEKSTHIGWSGKSHRFTKQWLAEIPTDKPEEKWLEHAYPVTITKFDRLEMKFAFSEGVKHEALKHRETESFDNRNKMGGENMHGMRL
jgi:hypothetical protein